MGEYTGFAISEEREIGDSLQQLPAWPGFSVSSEPNPRAEGTCMRWVGYDGVLYQMEGMEMRELRSRSWMTPNVL